MKNILLILCCSLFFSCKNDNKTPSTSNPSIEKTVKISNKKIPIEKGKLYSKIKVYDYINANELGYKEIELEKPTNDPIYASISELISGGLSRSGYNFRITKVSRNGKIWEIHLRGETRFTDAQDEQKFMRMIRKTVELYTSDYKIFLNDNVLNLK